MEPEILKKLEAIESRLSKVEALSIAMSQKLVAVKMLKVEPLTNALSLLGLLLLYVAGYGAYSYFGVVSAGTSFLLLALITAFCLVLSFRKNSETVALFAVAMGFLAPYLFGLRAASDFGYFVYILTLNVGLLSVSFFKQWRLLALVGFIGTVADLSSWYGFYYSPDKLLIALYALGVSYSIYLAVAMFNEVAHGFESYQSDVIMLITNPIWFILGLRYLLEPENDAAFIAMTIATCALYIALALLHLIFKYQKRPGFGNLVS